MSNSEPKYQHGDWLYNLILDEAEWLWQRCSRKIDEDHWQYVLITEWSSETGGVYMGDALQSWIRDKDGLREISLSEYKEHMDKIHDRIYPFITMGFYIFPDRQHVIIGRQEADTSGSGGQFIVQISKGKAKLEPDEHSGMWVS